MVVTGPLGCLGRLAAAGAIDRCHCGNDQACSCCCLVLPSMPSISGPTLPILINSRVASTIDAALERGRCGLWDWDVVQGRIYWSASMFEMLGLEMKDPIISYGSLIDLMHPDDPGAGRSAAERVLHGLDEAIERDFRLRQADGNWLWVRIRGKRVVDDLSGMTHIVGIAIDISGERAAQSQSEILNRRIREAIEATTELFRDLGWR